MTDEKDVICECQFASIEPLEVVLASVGNPRTNALALRFADGSPVPPPLHTSVISFWNRRALTVVFSSAYRRPIPPSPGRVGRTERLWELEDVFEVFIGRDARRSLTYLEFEVAPDGRWIDLEISLQGGLLGSAPSPQTGVQCLSRISNGRWEAAFEIPWHALGCASDLPDSLDCNFYRSIPPALGGYLLAWAPVGYGENCFHRPEKFGRIILRK